MRDGWDRRALVISKHGSEVETVLETAHANLLAHTPDTSQHKHGAEAAPRDRSVNCVQRVWGT